MMTRRVRLYLAAVVSLWTTLGRAGWPEPFEARWWGKPVRLTEAKPVSVCVGFGCDNRIWIRAHGDNLGAASHRRMTVVYSQGGAWRKVNVPPVGHYETHSAYEVDLVGAAWDLGHPSVSSAGPVSLFLEYSTSMGTFRDDNDGRMYTVGAFYEGGAVGKTLGLMSGEITWAASDSTTFTLSLEAVIQDAEMTREAFDFFRRRGLPLPPPSGQVYLFYSTDGGAFWNWKAVPFSHRKSIVGAANLQSWKTVLQLERKKPTHTELVFYLGFLDRHGDWHYDTNFDRGGDTGEPFRFYRLKIYKGQRVY